MKHANGPRGLTPSRILVLGFAIVIICLIQVGGLGFMTVAIKTHPFCQQIESAAFMQKHNVQIES